MGQPKTGGAIFVRCEFNGDEALLHSTFVAVSSLLPAICEQTVSVDIDQMQVDAIWRLQSAITKLGDGERPPDFLRRRIQYGLENQFRFCVAH